MRLFVAGLREMHPDKAYAPDANSTMRLTYGLVDDYKAADAVHYDFYTTTVGILEKRDDSNPEFVVPAKLKELYEAKIKEGLLLLTTVFELLYSINSNALAIKRRCC